MFRIQRSGLKVQRSGLFRAQGRVQGAGLRAQRSKFKLQASRLQASGLRGLREVPAEAEIDDVGGPRATRDMGIWEP